MSSTHFPLPAAVTRARRATVGGGRREPRFRVAIIDGHGGAIAEVERTLCIRRQAGAAPARPAPRRRKPAMA